MASFALGPIATSRGYRVFGFDETGSTSSDASRAAEAGDVGEVWFAALKQTAGRGRRGRSWETPSGNLAASLLLVPDCDPSLAATLGFVAGVALNRALVTALPAGTVKQGIDGADGPGHRVALKWPNDVLADGKKICGILLEAEGVPGGLAVVAGMGTNVVAAPTDTPTPAISLAALGIQVSAEDLFSALSDAWVEFFGIWDSGRGFEEIRKLWLARAAGLGRAVAVTSGGSTIEGIFDTIDGQGCMIIQTPAGRRMPVSAGDVYFGTAASRGTS